MSSLAGNELWTAVPDVSVYTGRYIGGKEKSDVDQRVLSGELAYLVVRYVLMSLYDDAAVVQQASSISSTIKTGSASRHRLAIHVQNQIPAVIEERVCGVLTRVVFLPMLTMI